ncbi:MAG: hypothetical protein KAT65_13205, partial [Methanophagales archaeon]|nr:hypothetical protein [Methanophagales archaeon]
DKWKLDPNCEGEIESLSSKAFGEIEKGIKEKGKEFTDESHQWVKSGIFNEEEFFKEKEARENLLNNFLLYERVCKRFMKSSEENYYLLLSETWKKIRDELNIAVNEVFSLNINKKRLNKGKGESMEHYLMRYAILEYLNEKRGVSDFQEEYSKLKEVLERFAKGEAGEKEWEKNAKRADVYVVLNDGSKLWIEVERTTSSSEMNKKLERLKVMLLHFPDLFDKVVFVFPSFILGMVEATLTEAREIGFPEEKLEFYEVNLRENRIVQLTNAKLIEVEFGDRMLDMIADGFGEPTKKTAREVKDRVKELVIIPLVNREWDEEYVISKKEKIKILISFWRKRTRKLPFGKLTEIEKAERDVKFKEEVALPRIKQNYHFLLK